MQISDRKKFNFRYSSLNIKQKTLLKHIWQKEWDIFIHSQIKKLNSTTVNPAEEYSSEFNLLSDEYFLNETNEYLEAITNISQKNSFHEVKKKALLN